MGYGMTLMAVLICSLCVSGQRSTKRLYEYVKRQGV